MHGEISTRWFVVCVILLLLHGPEQVANLITYLFLHSFSSATADLLLASRLFSILAQLPHNL